MAFLGGKARRQKSQPAALGACLACVVDPQLIRPEHLFGEAAVGPLHHALDTLDLDDVRPDAIDGAGHPGGSGLFAHTGTPGWAAEGVMDDKRAATMIAFISRTAFCQPANTACATTAWPMFSSWMPAMAAMGCTFV